MTNQILIKRLIEKTAVGGRVDRQNGIVRGVKILGARSKNGRIYSNDALEKVTKFYEGVGVKIDHSEAAERPLMDDVGILTNIRRKDDGIFGDFQILTSHPYAAAILERAERFPGSFGFSHQADGRVEVREGIEHVVDIVSVESVDLVSKPATNKSLFESVGEGDDDEEAWQKDVFNREVRGDQAEPEKYDAAQIEELDLALSAAISAILIDHETDEEEKLKLVADLVNGEAVTSSREKPTPESEAEPVPLSVAIHAVLENSDLSLTDTLRTIGRMVGVEPFLQEDVEEPGEPVGEEEEVEEVDESEDKLTLNSIRAAITDALMPLATRVAQLEKGHKKLDAEVQESLKRGRIKSLFESRGIKSTPEQVEIAAQLSGDSRERYLTELREIQEQEFHVFPRSSGDGGRDSTHGYERISSRGLANFLKSGLR